MARGINKVILVGRLGGDPEQRFMPNGNPVTNFTLATSEEWNDKQTGQKQQRTEWHRIVMFNKLAEIAAQYLQKGSQAYIEGQLRTRKWQGQDGQDRYTTEIVASELQMLDSRNDNGVQQPGQAPQHRQQGAQPQGGYVKPEPYQQGQQGGQPADGFDDFDESIPF